jgi:hypothetical protein
LVKRSLLYVEWLLSHKASNERIVLPKLRKGNGKSADEDHAYMIDSDVFPLQENERIVFLFRYY